MSWVAVAVTAGSAIYSGVSSSRAKKKQAAADAKAKKEAEARAKQISKEGGGMGEMHIPQRNLLQEGRDSLKLMKEAYPQIYELGEKWNGKYAEQEARTGERRALGEKAAVDRMGTGIRDSLRASSPEIEAASDAMLAELRGTGPSEIETTLADQAIEELRLGGKLSADESRSVREGSRAAWSARGLSASNPAMVSEVMNRDSASQARKAGRRQFAAGVDAQVQQRKAGDRSYVINAGNTAMNWFDPYLRIYGKGGSGVTGNVSGPGTYQPWLSAGQDVGKSNQAANMQGLAMQQENYQFGLNRADTAYYTAMNQNATNQNAAAQRSSAESSATMGAVTNILSAYLSSGGYT